MAKVPETPAQNWPRPNNPKLAKYYDKALQDGLEIRYADDERLVTFKKQQRGCGWFLVLLALTVLSLGIALLLGLVELGRESGTLTTYTVTKRGKIKIKKKYL